MEMIYIIGVDISEGSRRALDFAKNQARLISQNVGLILVCVVGWSPYKLQNSEGNENRRLKKIEEVDFANKRVIEHLIKKFKEEVFDVESIVAHGNFVKVLNEIASKKNADQIFISRFPTSKRKNKISDTAAAQILFSSNIPVTIVN